VKSFNHAGTTALVTGASSGIGEQFVRELTRRGTTHLVLSARNEQRLAGLATELSRTHSIRTTIIPADLGQAGGAHLIVDSLQRAGVPVDVLVNNAGFANHGRFGELDGAAMTEQITLNCTNLVALTSALLPPMLERDQGAIINVASTAAFQPLPYMAVYGASKAFVLSFSEALWGELHNSDVRVLALCPGATDTPFFDRLGTDDASVGSRQSPEKVVQVALKALDRGRPNVVSGRRNALLAFTPRFVSRRTTIRITERTLRPSTPSTSASKKKAHP
jgi:uncharacterized protein